jgi:hypothetical protein
MINPSARRSLRIFLVGVLFALAPSIAHAQWTPPTPEELSMTTQPEVPGAAAVYLNREETTEDRLHIFTIYVRLKVLTDLGKDFGNVELQYARFHNDTGFSGYSIEDVQGRTIHPDGTIIPFTGKPYEKLVERTHSTKVMAKVFTMPDITVGSILEYRYKLRYDENFFEAPSWFLQSRLFTRNAHYTWLPVDLKSIMLVNARDQAADKIAWSSFLPHGAQVVQTRTLQGEKLELSLQDIRPVPEEDFMPPIQSFTYRVLFYYTAYHSADEFWKNEGKFWAKKQDKFIGPGSVIDAAVKDIVTPSDTSDQKLRKLYAAVMKLENTRYTREHTTAEEKAQGLKEVRTTDDIWTRKRGSDDQITALFVAMARAAGFKAYIGAVTSREHDVFVKNYLNLSQLNDFIAIVSVDGKDQLFDPGTRFCPYGHLAWQHTLTGGIRQTADGSDFFGTPAESYAFSRTLRAASLNVNPEGALSGKLSMTYMGDPAIRWRHRLLEGDSASLEREIRTSVENLMPSGVEVKMTGIDKADDYEQPFVANFEVKGTLGSSTGKRVLLPGDIFEANSKPNFSQEKRENSVYFDYPHLVRDAVRITFDPKFSIESLPAFDKNTLEKSIAYSLSSESTANSFTIHRDYILADIIYSAAQYPNLRSFYSKIETKDHENVVLTTASASAKPAGN